MQNKTVRDSVIVMVRDPRAGEVKTRLAESIGKEQAAELYRCFVQDMLEKMDGGPWKIEIQYTPEKNRDDFKIWLGENKIYVLQRGENLGQRMQHAFEDCFARRCDRAILIGTDLPDLPAQYIKQGFEEFENADIILGPTLDGGYYLIGFTKEGFTPILFENIQWGSDRVLMQTIAQIHKIGKPAALLSRWYDVDTAEDLEELRIRCEEGYSDCSYTTQWIRKYLES